MPRRPAQSKNAKTRDGERPARTRRAPEVARALILDAASVVLADLGPDRAGLKEVAAGAGVSHALVTHYFGTFSALVEEVLAVQMGNLREAIIEQIAAAGPDLAPQQLIRTLFAELRKPVYGRLVAWAFLSGRVDQASFFARQRKGLRYITDAALARAAQQGHRLDRDELERLVILVWCTVASYAVAAPTLWRALGRRPSKRRDEQFEALIVEIVSQRIGGD